MDTNILQDLKPVHGKVKSYYHKAHVVEYGCGKLLYSYGDLVCAVLKGQKDYLVTMEAFSSKTTRRHVDEFLEQEGISVYVDRHTLYELGKIATDVEIELHFERLNDPADREVS